MGVTAKDNRLFVDAVLYRYGRAFRGEICRIGSGTSDGAHALQPLGRSGVWEKIFKCLAVDADNEYALIDSTIVRAHQHSAVAQKKGGDNQALGRSRGVTKQQNSRHRGCFGKPTSFALMPGQAHDLEEDDLLLPTIQADAVIAEARRVT